MDTNEAIEDAKKRMPKIGRAKLSQPKMHPADETTQGKLEGSFDDQGAKTRNKEASQGKQALPP